MKIYIHTNYALQLGRSLASLQDDIGCIPEPFVCSRNVNDLCRPKGVGFDVNEFLTLFDRIGLKDGTVLDYAYYYQPGFGGRPLVYSRKQDEPSLSANEYIRKFQESHEATYLRHIMIENDPQSFFQLTVFSQAVQQFYLDWHSLYNDERFILSRKSAEEIFSSNRPRMQESGISKQRLNNISFAPLVAITDCGAQVRCVMFSAWTGFYYSYSQMFWPDLAMEKKTEVIIPYDCGIRF